MRPTTGAAEPTASERAAKKPNVVVIMTDDQTTESVRVMPHVQRLLAKQGTTFDQNVVSYPLCCPSRATYLTGQYATNHGVRGNLPPWGGYGAFQHQDTTFPVALQAAGYETVHIGKYLNGYGDNANPASVPPGWSQWYGSVDPSTYQYYGFTLLENGVEKTYPKRGGRYQADVYTDLAVSKIRRTAKHDQPFFVDVAYLAPHVQAREGSQAEELGRAVPARRHLGTLSDEPLARSPSFNEQDVSTKPEFIQTLSRFSKRERAAMRATYDRYLESLLAVDEGVGRIVATLRRAGVLDNTVIIFTSDNGFFFGEHRIRPGKGRFYEPSIRTPLVMRGPDIPRKATNSALVANTDLAPTILEWADATSLRTIDGASLVPVLAGRPPADRAVLLQEGGPYRPDWGIRTPRYAYFEYATGERELYDLRDDPDQLVNLAGRPEQAAVQAELALRLTRLETCAGITCR